MVAVLLVEKLGKKISTFKDADKIMAILQSNLNEAA
jgi:hypothetical protein